MTKFIFYGIIASVLIVIGLWAEVEDAQYINTILLLVGGVFCISAIWSIFNEILIEVTDNIGNLAYTKQKAIIDTIHAVRGLSQAQTELVAKQLYFHVEG